jgi:hypothetical protein
MTNAEFKAIKAKLVAQKDKATDMDVLIAAISKLPPGQLKKVLSEEVLAVLKKYGYGG